MIDNSEKFRNPIEDLLHDNIGRCATIAYRVGDAAFSETGYIKELLPSSPSGDYVLSIGKSRVRVCCIDYVRIIER